MRYTERPDVATACIMEGDVVVLVDNSASALLLPTTILRFNEEISAAVRYREAGRTLPG